MEALSNHTPANMLLHEAATLTGVTTNNLKKLAKGRLKPAISGERGEWIDIAHPCYVEYVEYLQHSPQKRRHKVIEPAKSVSSPGVALAISNPAPGLPLMPPRPVGVDPRNNPLYEDIVDYMDCTLHELLRNFGSMEQFKRLVDTEKNIEDIRMRRLKRAEKEGLLIPRDMVRQHIFAAIENVHVRLLNDFPKSGARRAVALVKSGSSPEDVEKELREIIQTSLKNLKLSAQRALQEEKGTGGVGIERDTT